MARPGRKSGMTREELLPDTETDDETLFGESADEERICSPDDVAEILGLSVTPESPWAERQIEAAISWAKRYLQMPELGNNATITITKDDVRCDAFIRCDEPEKVEVLWYPDGEWEELTTSEWDYAQSGVRLRPSWWYEFYDPRYTSFPTLKPWFYTQVKITIEQSGDVDPAIREGVAMAAAALVIRRNRLAKGLLSESIGGYSYSMQRTNTAEAGEDPFFSEAKSLLRPLRKAGGVTST